MGRALFFVIIGLILFLEGFFSLLGLLFGVLCPGEDVLSSERGLELSLWLVSSPRNEEAKKRRSEEAKKRRSEEANYL